MGINVWLGVLALALTPVVRVGPVPASASACDPLTAAVVDSGVPTAGSVLGFPLGSRPVSAAESDAYLARLDAASPRVTSGTLGATWEGRPVRYAVVGRPDRVTPTALARIGADARRLRDPDLPPATAARVARANPAILWIVAGQHNSEVSAVDGALRVLYDLAARTDCAARTILDNAIVVIVPDLNPDGRDTASRVNHYRFNLNLDWMTRTQPEIDATVELMRRWPPALLLDLHEMPRGGYFFPPSDDPYYHEIPDRSVRWQTDLYGPAAADAFTRSGVPFTPYRFPYQFGPWMSSTAVSVGWLGVGATLEKTASEPLPQKIEHHRLAVWALLSAAAGHRREILSGVHDSYREALAQGRAGALQPNRIVNPANELERAVPDATVRHYFLRDDPAKRVETQELVRRLQRMDVTVRRLAKPLTVPDYHPYGRAARAETLPAGTYWIPLAQGQKHWIQAALNESTYPPTHTLNDQLRGWSLPLAANVDGGWSGAKVRPEARVVPPLPAPVADPLPARRIAILADAADLDANPGWDSIGWLRHTLEQKWHAPYTVLSGADVAAGGLAGIDTLLVPAPGPTVDAQLGPAGTAAIGAFVRGGGRYVGWRGGATLATRLGITSASVVAEPEDYFDGVGGLVRARVDPGSPLAAGVGSFVWTPDSYDTYLMTAPAGHVVSAFPPADHEDFFVSGHVPRADRLAGFATVVREPVGAGSTTLFSFDPNFFGWTDGAARILRNALAA